MNELWLAPLIAFYAAVLLWVAWVDLKTRRIPNKVIGPALVVALVAMPWTVGVGAGLLGGLLAPLPLLIARVMTGKAKMGMGDVKLAVFVGLILGYELAVAGLAIGLVLALLGAAAGVMMRKRTWRSTQPFAPYFAAATLPLLLAAHLLA